MKKILIVILLLATFSCNHKADQSPRKINWNRDVCANCLMGVTDQKYAAQAINKYEDVLWFDDLGCLIQYMGTEDWKKFGGDEAKIWVGDCETGQWLDAKKAWYRYGDHSPMGYGYGALKEKADSTYDFKTVVQRIHDGITMREKFLKEKKMMMKGKESK